MHEYIWPRISGSARKITAHQNNGMKERNIFGHSCTGKPVSGFLTRCLACCAIFLIQGCQSENVLTLEQSTEIMVTRSLGLADLEESKLTEAEARFRKQIELAPEEPSGYANLAVTLMRAGRYAAAEQQVRRALSYDSQNPDIRLILAKIYELSERKNKARAVLEGSLQIKPGHARTLYALAGQYLGRATPAEQARKTGYLKRLVDLAPGNLTARLQLIEALVRTDALDSATMHLEELRKQLPELPAEPEAYLEKGLSFLRTGQTQKSLTAVTVLHNYLKVTPLYRAGLIDLKGIGGQRVGLPILTLDSIHCPPKQRKKSVLSALRFTDVTAEVGLDLPRRTNFPANVLNHPLSLTVADYDHDGDPDLYAAGWSAREQVATPFLFRNDSGKFVEVAAASGLRHPGPERNAVFADFDNDGYADLYVVNDAGGLLYLNDGSGHFKDVTATAGLTGTGPGTSALFADLDHEGDLDLYVCGKGENQLYRNNSAGSFTESAKRVGIAGGETVSQDAVFADFDDDGDLDLFVVNESTSNILYSNLRQGRFEDITAEVGLTSAGGGMAAAVGDVDNNGTPDLFVTGQTRQGHTLYRNKGDGTFETDDRSDGIFADLENIEALDAIFLDFDNDGFLDLLVTGKPSTAGNRGLFLFRNDGTGAFTPASHLLPENVKAAGKVAVADYDDDGDLDIFAADFDGSVHLLRNDGGNVNHYLKIQLVGLRKGSSKNNYFGVGAKIEVRAGELYESQTVTDAVTHFGLGQHDRADFVRVLWTNGVPQNIFSTASNQKLVEEQILKGSCAFLYTWNGSEYTFVKDLMWRSALGMPLGIMGGSTAYAFPNASREWLKVSGQTLKAEEGVYHLRITEELWETAYFDELKMVAVDHPDSIDIFVNEKFVPPPFPGLEIYDVPGTLSPTSARDEAGNDLLPMIREKDDVYAANLLPVVYQGLTRMHDLILDPGPAARQDTLFLFLNGWLFPTDASINVALAQSNAGGAVAPYLQVLNAHGEWQTVLPNLGFPMGKDKTIIADLTGKFLSSDRRVRIRTNMEIYWDHIFFAPKVSGRKSRLTPLPVLSAELHHRGFSKTYRKGGRYGPHWFDYSNVSIEPKWRDLIGNYTRYGDVLPLLSAADDQYVIINSGDEIMLELDANPMPKLAPGWSRDFVIYTVGWIKDGDLNTAHGKTVAPLPFHAMTAYPYGPEDRYPGDPVHQAYQKKYNTREVTTDELKRLVRERK